MLKLSSNGVLKSNELKEFDKGLQEGSKEFFFNGGGGNGKTTSVIEICEKYGVDIETEVIGFGPTGGSVNALSSRGIGYNNTIHAATSIRISKNTTEYSQTLMNSYGLTISDFLNGVKNHKKINETKKMFKGKKVIYVDEVSMLGDWLFEVTRDFINAYKEEDAIVIYAGDFAQLPPVKQKSSLTMFANLIVRGDIHQVFFETRYRGIQKELNDFCTDMRNGEFTKGRRYNEFMDYLYDNTTVHNLTLDDFEELSVNQALDFQNKTIVAWKNNTVDRINKKMISLLETKQYFFNPIITEDTFDKGKKATRKMYNEYRKALRFVDNLELKIGSIIMFNANHRDKSFYVNGEQGVLLDVIVENGVEKIVVEKTEDKKIVKVPRHQFRTDERQRNLGYKIDVLQFPVKLAYAITVNGSQGKSITNLVIFIDDFMFGSGKKFNLFYTAFTRSVDINNLEFISEINYFEDDYENRAEFHRVFFKSSRVDYNSFLLRDPHRFINENYYEKYGNI